MNQKTVLQFFKISFNYSENLIQSYGIENVQKSPGVAT